MTTNRQGLKLAQTAFPDYFSEPRNAGNKSDGDFIGVKDFVRLSSCKKNTKREKQNKPTFQEIFEWFQREYGLPQFKAITESEMQGKKLKTDTGIPPERSDMGNSIVEHK